MATQLTPAQIKRLKKLLALHRNPPTAAGLFAKGSLLTVVWMGLIVTFGFVADGDHSPILYYCLGLVSFFPLLSIMLLLNFRQRWAISEAVTNWSLVEQLVNPAE